MPAAVASQCVDATTPNVPRISGRVVNVLMLPSDADWQIGLVWRQVDSSPLLDWKRRAAPLACAPRCVHLPSDSKRNRLYPLLSRPKRAESGNGQAIVKQSRFFDP